MKTTINELMADQLVSTDEGTHGMPQTVRVYERLDGTRYAVLYFAGSAVGTCEPQSKYGRMREIQGFGSAKSRQSQIEHLRRLEIEAGKSAEKIEARKQELRRGWDGYRFVGVDEGSRLAGV